MAAVSASLRKFIVPEAYPIIFFTSSAAALFTGFVARLLVSDPDVMCTKARRSSGYLDPEIETKTAERHYNHFIRRAMGGNLENVGIFPNEAIIRMTSKN